jgi:hypothetical protein
MAQLHLLPSIESAGREAEPRHQRPGAVSGPTVTHETTTTTARATTTIVDADGATIATTTTTAAGHQISEVHGPLARASVTRSFLHASVLRPMYRDTTGTLTPAYGSRTTGSRAMPGE